MRTLICIRQLPYAEETIRFGTIFSKLESASISLMTVVEDADSVDEAEGQLKAIRESMNLPRAKIVVRAGHVLQEILTEVQESDYDYVVVGTHEVAGFLDIFLGSITSKVADKAPVSVLVVREGSRELKKILVGVGGQKYNKALVEAGANLALAAEARVTALHVTAPIPSMYTGLEGMEESLEEMLQTDTPIAQHLRWSAQFLAERGIISEIKIRRGVAVEEILREADLGEYDLIILGESTAQGPFRGLLTEKITPQVVDRAKCSVLVVKDPPD